MLSQTCQLLFTPYRRPSEAGISKVRGKAVGTSITGAKARTFVIQTNEELMIAMDTVAILSRQKGGKGSSVAWQTALDSACSMLQCQQYDIKIDLGALLHPRSL